jgi:hypothetical protein
MNFPKTRNDTELMNRSNTHLTALAGSWLGRLERNTHANTKLVIGVLVLVAAGVCLMGATSSNAAGSRFQTSPTVRAQGVSGYKGTSVVTVPGTVVNHYATLAVSAPAGSSRILVTYPGGEHGLRAHCFRPVILL